MGNVIEECLFSLFMELPPPGLPWRCGIGIMDSLPPSIRGSRRCRLASGASGFGEEGFSVGVCMVSFRFGGFTTPEAPAMPMRKKAENAWSPARYMINRRPCWSKIASMSSTSVVASTAAPSPVAQGRR